MEATGIRRNEGASPSWSGSEAQDTFAQMGTTKPQRQRLDSQRRELRAGQFCKVDDDGEERGRPFRRAARTGRRASSSTERSLSWKGGRMGSWLPLRRATSTVRARSCALSFLPYRRPSSATARAPRVKNVSLSPPTVSSPPSPSSLSLSLSWFSPLFYSSRCVLFFIFFCLISPRWPREPAGYRGTS